MCCATTPTIKLIMENIISVLKRKWPDVFKTPLEVSSTFWLGIAICIQNYEFPPNILTKLHFWNLWIKKSINYFVFKDVSLKTEFMGGTYGNEEHYYGLKKLFYLVYKERKFSSAKTQLTSYTEKAECKSK
jgi:hypothetical protein